MVRHGSESYFVLGEGLLGEALGGRMAAPVAIEAEAAPPFRFSRMGPKGTGKQLSEANRTQIARAIAQLYALTGSFPCSGATVEVVAPAGAPMAASISAVDNYRRGEEISGPSFAAFVMTVAP